MVCAKVLVFGSVDGKFSKFFKKVSNLNKKNGPFEMVICTGNFFSADCKKDWDAFRKKKERIDVPIYILGPCDENLEQFYGTKEDIEDGVELLDNVLYLGRKGIFKTTSGFVISYLSGCGTKGPHAVKKTHVDSLLEQVRKDDKFCGVDFLLTSAWPRDVTKHTKSDVTLPQSSAFVSLVSSVLKPRYHLSHSDDVFYERPPYRNHQVKE